MPAPPTTKRTIRKNTIKNMEKLGTYKPEYDAIIDIYSELCEQYERLTKKFKDEEYKYESFGGNGGAKKSPLVATLESLRKDILIYSDRLCLNPKSMTEDKKPPKKKSRLSAALENLEND